MSLFISKAVSIRWWLAGEETFSEVSKAGINTVFKWRQKYNLADANHVQIIDTEYKNYKLVAILHGNPVNPLDSGYAELGSKALTVVSTVDGYRYSADFTLTELGVTNGQTIRLLLQSEALPEPVPEALTVDITLAAPIGGLSASITVS